MKPALLAGTVLLAAAAALPAAAADHQVTIEGMRYVPARVAAKVGDTVTFVNKDTVTHEVFSPTPGFGVNLGDVKPGETLVMTLRKAGRFDIECGFHPKMTTRIAVAK